MTTERGSGLMRTWDVVVQGGLSRLPASIGLIAAYIVMLILLSILSPYFFSVNNFLDILLAVAVIGIISIGMTMVIVSGGLDLSVGAVVALVGVAIAQAQPVIGMGGAVALGFLVGIIFGLINGLAVTWIGINPLITTLATLSLARGLAFVLSGGLTQPVLDEGFGFWGRGFVFGIVPVPVVILLVLLVASHFVFRYSTFGRALYAIGGNPRASRLAGLGVKRVQRLVYLVCAIGAAVGGILLTSELGAGAPQAATGIELSVIAAVILGGTSLAGGKGTIAGTFLGVLIMGTLNNGLVLLNVSAYYQEVARGLVLLGAVAMDQLRVRGG
jgi:ribose transport system permease protein